jgi:hypothetical protein
LHSAQIKKSDDLDNACAKSLGFEALLAQAVQYKSYQRHGSSTTPWEVGDSYGIEE